MSNYRIRLSPRARDNIIDIGDYISHTILEPLTSKRFIKDMKHSILSLRQFPYRYPTINPNDNRLDIRCMPFKNFYIFYTIDDTTQTVTILRVGYNKRNWTHILRL